jgi:hypothetical protein
MARLGALAAAAMARSMSAGSFSMRLAIVSMPSDGAAASAARSR